MVRRDRHTVSFVTCQRGLELRSILLHLREGRGVKRKSPFRASIQQSLAWKTASVTTALRSGLMSHCKAGMTAGVLRRVGTRPGKASARRVYTC